MRQARIRLQVLGVEPGESFGQVFPVSRRDPGIGRPMLRELLRQKSGIHPIRVGQHQVRPERVAALQRPFAGFVAQPARPQLGQIDQRGLEVMHHRRDKDVATGLRVRLPECSQHLGVTVQPEARKERRVVLDAVFVALDLLLQGVEGFQAGGGGGGCLDVVDCLPCSLEVPFVAQAGDEHAGDP